MPVLLISDIFGRTPALETICEQLSQTETGIQMIDPYNGVNHGFETEADAYAYFMDRVGIKKYQAILKDPLKVSGKDTTLVGFSVGAYAIWGISHLASLKHIKKAFCFYGSQIRHQTGILPVFDIKLIFPEHEPHFNVDRLIQCLNKKEHVTCSKANGLHGFMNKLSSNFSAVCYKKFIHHLKTSLSPEK